MSFDYPSLPPPPACKIEIWTGLGTLSFDYKDNPPLPLPSELQGNRMLRLISVSPMDTISLNALMTIATNEVIGLRYVKH